MGCYQRDRFMLDYIQADAPIIHERIMEVKKDANTSLSWYIPLCQIADNHLSHMSKRELDADWKLQDFFGTIAVINLPDAKDRLQRITQELHSIGVDDFTVFPAIDGRKELDSAIWNKFYLNLHNIDSSTDEGKHALDLLHQGQAGCYMSHYQLIQQIKKAFDNAWIKLELAKTLNDKEGIYDAEQEILKYSRVLILEDDCGFGFLDQSTDAISKKGAGKLLRQAFSELPDDWDILYLIAHATEPTIEASSHLRKLGRGWCMMAYAINFKMYDSLVEHLGKIEDPDVTHIWPVDSEIYEIHQLYNVYAIYPSIAYAQNGVSHITGKTWEYWQGQPVYPLVKLEKETKTKKKKRL